MCGIGGCIASPGQRPDRAALERMGSAMRHRGPDDDGLEIDGAVGFVHRRLSIVDPSPAGHQPMADPSGRWTVTYNGEIFNHLDLRRELGAVAWSGGSDTETLLRALGAWEDDAIGRCNGLYAYAALDRARGRVLLVRDRFGVKPLYVARHAGALWFASEIKALLAAGVPARPRVELLEHTLERSWVNGEATLLDGIDRVLPGTVVEIDVATLSCASRRWYDPAAHVDERRMSELDGLDRQAAGDAVETALRNAVRRRLMADVPVGTMCSGGIDSSLITAFAHDEHPQVHAFNASVSDQPGVDESAYATEVAEHLGIELHTVAMTAESFCADLVGVVDHIEYPLNHESSVPMSHIAELASSHGVKVLLSGEGADELFGGYGWLHDRDWRDLAHPRSPLRPARWMARRTIRRGPPPDEVAGLGPAAQVVAYERDLVAAGTSAYDFHRGAVRRLEGALVGDLGTYLPHLLNRQDKSTMKASIETRVPFLDPEVVGLALNLPLRHRVFPERKGVLRDLAERHLPASIGRRPKVGFGFDACAYIAPRTRPEALVDGRLRDLLGVPREDWRRRVDPLRGQPGLLLWTAEAWCRLVVDGASVAAVERELWR